jgi:hypothetical protein
VKDGTAPHKWTVSGLPSGLALGNTVNGVATISGTPTQSFMMDVFPMVTDSSNPQRTGQIRVSLRIQEVLTVTAPRNPMPGMVGKAFMLTLTAAGGAEPYTWALVANQVMPPGLALNGEVISGTPTAPVTNAPVSVVVGDSGGQKAQAIINITIQSEQGPYPPPTPTKVCAEINKTQRCFTVPAEVIASIQKFMVEYERAGLDATGKPLYKYPDWWSYFAANIQRTLAPVLDAYPTPDVQKARANLAAAEAALQKAKDAVVTGK